MSNPLSSLNENFSYNSMLARALLQLLPAKDTQFIHSWLHIMHEMDGTVGEMTIRNEYMWFLLLQLQGKRVTEPFNHPPRSRNLLPLRDVLPGNIYEEVLLTTERHMSRLENLEADDSAKKQDGAQASGSFQGPPAEFFKNQPKPKHGFICYAAAFSDRS